MRKNLFLAFLILLGCCGYAQTGISTPDFNASDTYLKNFMTKWSVTGASMTISKDGKLKYLRSFGFSNVEDNILTQPHTLFRIASISKSITSIGIMKLMQEGKLSLSDKVFGPGGILENFPDIKDANITDERIYDITVQHLLEHTAGWDNAVNCFPSPTTPYPYTFYGCNPKDASLHVAELYGASAPPPASLLIRFMVENGVNFTPGTRHVYSNQGYSTLGRVIEAVTNMKYEDYIKSAILHPLGIFDTHVGKALPEDFHERESLYYAVGNVKSIYGTGEDVPWQYGGQNIPEMDALGGWTTTARDLNRLLVAIDGYDTKPDILTAETLAIMTTPSTAYQYYAKGWAVRTDGRYWHNGQLPGTYSIWVRSIQGYTYTIILNKDRNDAYANQFRNEFDNLASQCIQSVTNWPEWDLMDVPTVNANALVANASATSIDLDWTNGNGQKRIVIAREKSSKKAFPLDGINYDASSVFGNGNDLGNGNFIVYNGTGSSVSVTGLIENTEYVFRVVEFNQSTNTGDNALYQLGNNAEIEVVASALSMEDNALAQFTIHPNPTKSLLYINAPKIGNNTTYAIYTLEGRILESGPLSEENTEINVDKLSAGIYFIKVAEGQTKSKTRKFIVE